MGASSGLERAAGSDLEKRIWAMLVGELDSALMGLDVVGEVVEIVRLVVECCGYFEGGYGYYFEELCCSCWSGLEA